MKPLSGRVHSNFVDDGIDLEIVGESFVGLNNGHMMTMVRHNSGEYFVTVPIRHHILCKSP